MGRKEGRGGKGYGPEKVGRNLMPMVPRLMLMSTVVLVADSVIFVTKIKTRTRIIGRRFQRTGTRIIVIQKTKTK